MKKPTKKPVKRDPEWSKKISLAMKKYWRKRHREEAA